MGRCARYMVFEVIVVGFKCYGIYGILYSNTRQTETVSILKSLQPNKKVYKRMQFVYRMILTIIEQFMYCLFSQASALAWQSFLFSVNRSTSSSFRVHLSLHFMTKLIQDGRLTTCHIRNMTLYQLVLHYNVSEKKYTYIYISQNPCRNFKNFISIFVR